MKIRFFSFRFAGFSYSIHSPTISIDRLLDVLVFRYGITIKLASKITQLISDVKDLE